MTDTELSKLVETDLEYIKFVFADTASQLIKAVITYTVALGAYWALV